MDETSKTHNITVKDFYQAFFGDKLPMTVAKVSMFTETVKPGGLPSGAEPRIYYYASVELAEKMLAEHRYTYQYSIGADKQVWHGFKSGEFDELLFGTEYQQVAEIETISVRLEPTL